MLANHENLRRLYQDSRDSKFSQETLSTLHGFLQILNLGVFDFELCFKTFLPIEETRFLASLMTKSRYVWLINRWRRVRIASAKLVSKGYKTFAFFPQNLNAFQQARSERNSNLISKLERSSHSIRRSRPLKRPVISVGRSARNQPRTSH